MKKWTVSFVGLLALFDAQAGQDFNCMQECFRQGYDRNYCIGMCDTRRSPPGGMLEQQGLPRNPAFDQLQQNADPPPLPKVTDHKCMKDCQKHGYSYRLCQKQCSF